jgi:hypothetical protein
MLAAEKLKLVHRPASAKSWQEKKDRHLVNCLGWLEVQGACVFHERGREIRIQYPSSGCTCNVTREVIGWPLKQPRMMPAVR